MILRRQGFLVSEAASVADAMHGLAEAPAPQWMLLDLMLPDGCGIDVLRKVRRERMMTRTCIITGCAGDMLTEARSVGADHTFIKPLNIEHLVSVMTAPA